MATVAEKIRAAADYIEAVGLHKGQSFENSPVVDDTSGVASYEANLERREKCCTWGALKSHDVPRSEIDAFARSVGLGSEIEIWGWNDAEERTQNEVVSALRVYAEKREARGE